MEQTDIVYRPEWTCGRYNAEKHVAIMYNLIAGYSFFFENYSADVINLVLQVGRNGKIDITNLAAQTSIAKESILPFIQILMQNGLMVDHVPSKEEIQSYRTQITAFRKQQPVWVDKPTAEKLPMTITNAERAYYDKVDNGNTVCSCMFELTYRCSEMCIHCYNPGATRNDQEISHRGDLKELTLEDYKRIINEMYDLGLVKVCLTGGDPFSKEFVWELIDYLYQKEIAFDIFTNGQRLTKDVQRLANYYPRLVGVSIYSGIAEDHDAITRIPGSWIRSMQVVKELSSLAVPMNLKCCVMQPNLHSYYMVADLAKQYGAQPQFELNITESNDGDICAKRLRLTEEQLQIVLRDKNIDLYVGEDVLNYGESQFNLSSSSCGAGGIGFCVTPTAWVYPCVAFPMMLGDLKFITMREILKHNRELYNWRKATIQENVSCGKYAYCTFCHICAGNAFVETGDFHKPAETNCYMAKCRYNLAQKLMKENKPMNREEFVEALQQLPKTEVVLQRQYHTRG